MINLALNTAGTLVNVITDAQPNGIPFALNSLGYSIDSLGRVVITGTSGGTKYNFGAYQLSEINAGAFANVAAFITNFQGFFRNASSASNLTTGTLSPSLNVRQVNSQDANAATYDAPLVGGASRRPKVIGLRNLALTDIAANTVLTLGGGTLPTKADVAAADAMFGATAMQVTTIAGNNIFNVSPSAVNSVVTNVTGGIIRMWFKVISGCNNFDKFGIQLFSAGTPGAPGTAWHGFTNEFGFPNEWKTKFTNTTNGAGVWQSFGIPVALLSAVGGGADLTNITWARWSFRSTAAAVIQLGRIEYLPNKLTKACCIIRLDDAYKSQYEVVAPLLDKYGFLGTFFPSPSATIGNDSTKMTIAQLKNLQARGHQIGSQGYTTESNTIIDAMTENQLTAEFSAMRNWQRGNGFIDGGDGSWFSLVSRADPNVLNAFIKSFNTIQGYYSGAASGNPFNIGETWPPGDIFNIRALNGASWTDSTNSAQVQAHVDQAITNVGLAIIAYHDDLAVGGNANVKTGFTNLLSYLDTHRSTIQVVTQGDLTIL